MVSLKSIVRVIILVISGIAIVVVGGFMMGAVARLWLPKHKKKPDPNADTHEHNKSIISQFTKQAIPFTNKVGHSNEKAFELMFELTGVCPSDTVLDIACGSGLVSCAFARIANHVTGIDITPAMIERAKLLQNEKQLHNITWKIGDVLPLPFEDESFSLVITRYSFHHFVNPKAVLDEMKRVCKVGGRIMIVDVTPDADKVDAYNYMEKLRDTSHTKALTTEQLQKMINDIELINQKKGFYGLEMELEDQLSASFPNPGDDEKLRQLFTEDLTVNKLGVNSHLVGNKIYFIYPTSIIVGQRQ